MGNHCCCECEGPTVTYVQKASFTSTSTAAAAGGDTSMRRGASLTTSIATSKTLTAAESSSIRKKHTTIKVSKLRNPRNQLNVNVGGGSFLHKQAPSLPTSPMSAVSPLMSPASSSGNGVNSTTTTTTSRGGGRSPRVFVYPPRGQHETVSPPLPMVRFLGGQYHPPLNASLSQSTLTSSLSVTPKHDGVHRTQQQQEPRQQHWQPLWSNGNITAMATPPPSSSSRSSLAAANDSSVLSTSTTDSNRHDLPPEVLAGLEADAWS